MIAKPDQLRRQAESMPSGSFVPVERDDLLALLGMIPDITKDEEIDRLNRTVDRKDDQLAEAQEYAGELRAALSKAIQAAWDGPAEMVGTGCAETYSQWRKRLEGECRAALQGAPKWKCEACALPTSKDPCAWCGKKREASADPHENLRRLMHGEATGVEEPEGGVLAFTPDDVSLDTHKEGGE